MSRSVVFAIDVEPDGQKCRSNDPWQGTHIALQRLSSLRGRLQSETGSPVHFNWFFRFDPEIERTWKHREWVTRACPDLIPSVLKHGDLTGVHVHLDDWDSARGASFSNFADAGWRAHCLATSAETYREIFGSLPIACRFGHRAIWNEDIAVLQQHGIRYDLTVEPDAPSHPLPHDAGATRWLPDYRGAPRVPYRPSPENYLIPASSDDADDFWIVPVSVTSTRHWFPLRRWPFLLRKPLPMNPVLRPRQVAAHLASELDRDGAEPLVIVLRSGDLAQSGFLANFQSVMDRLALHAGRCTFVRVDRAVQEFACEPISCGLTSS